MPRDASELARRLARDAEAVCRHYLSNGRRQGRYCTVGDVRNTPGRSMYVRLSGPDSGPGAAAHWTDADRTRRWALAEPRPLTIDERHDRELDVERLAGLVAEALEGVHELARELHRRRVVLRLLRRCSAEQLRDDFGTFLSSFPDADAAMRAEALFYQGCAALEAGDTGQAILSFRQSEQLAPNLPQRAIRRTFLVQLAAPGNRATGRN